MTSSCVAVTRLATGGGSREPGEMGRGQAMSDGQGAVPERRAVFFSGGIGEVSTCAAGMNLTGHQLSCAKTSLDFPITKISSLGP